MKEYSRILKWAPAAILVFTALLYCRVLFNNFVNLDDDIFILNNPLLKNFSLNGIKAIFTSVRASGDYHPLTTLINLLQYKLFGTDPLPYHALNILLHLLNTWLVFILAEKLSHNRNTACVVALLFAIHPMHVESVVWASELKDVLYAFFYLFSLLTYLNYLDHGYRKKHYAFLMLYFLASLLSKSAAVTLPVLLIAIDVYKGRKINISNLTEKIPLLLLSLFFGILAIISQRHAIDFGISSGAYTLIDRVFLISYAVAFYLLKLVFPFGLCVMHFYPDIKEGALPLQYYAALPFLIIIAILVIRQKNFRKEILFGCFFFLISISVMIQFVPFGYTITAERYTYIPYAGLFYLAGQWISSEEVKRRKKILLVLFALFVIMFSYLTWERIGIWKNGTSLFTDVVKKNPDNYPGHYNLGYLKFQKEDIKGALEEYNKVLFLKPDFAMAYCNRGYMYLLLGEMKLAMIDFNKAISLDTAIALGYYDRGKAFGKMGDTASALKDYNKAVQLNPAYILAYVEICLIEIRNGNIARARNVIDKAIEQDPWFANSYCMRGVVKNIQKDYHGAVEDFTYALTLDRDKSKDPLIYYYRAGGLLNMKDTAGACEDWKKALNGGDRDARKMLDQYCR
jgi:protein O-mannosyl-transferase